MLDPDHMRDDRRVPENAAKKLVHDFFDGGSEYFDIMKEGDDDQRFFSEIFLSLLKFVEGGKTDNKKVGETFYFQNSICQVGTADRTPSRL